MHESVLRWVEARVRNLGIAEAKVLELGSLIVNGSARELFSGEYVGLDLIEGEGVDVVADAHRLPFPVDSFDVVLCTEMVEHDSAFWLTMFEAGRVLCPGGHLLLTTRGNGFRYHGFPFDYWRFTADGMRELLLMAQTTVVEITEDSQYPGWFAHGRKEDT